MERYLSYDIASFLACINMLKINTSPTIYKMLIAVLCDFSPEDQANRNRTIRYVKILLEEQADLADCVISFLPSSSNSLQSSSASANKTRIPQKAETDADSSIKSKTKIQAGKLVAQATANKKAKAGSKSAGQGGGKSNSGKTVVVKTRTPVLIKQKGSVESKTDTQIPISSPKPVNNPPPTVLATAIQRNPTTPTAQIPSNCNLGGKFSVLNPESKINRDGKKILPTSSQPIKPPDLPYPVPLSTSTYPYVLGQHGPYFSHGSHFYGVPFGVSSYPFTKTNPALPTVKPVYLPGMSSLGPPKFRTQSPNDGLVSSSQCHRDKLPDAYLLPHSLEKKLTGPESIAPHVRTKPTCIIPTSEDNSVATLTKKSPCTHNSKPSNKLKNIFTGSSTSSTEGQDKPTNGSEQISDVNSGGGQKTKSTKNAKSRVRVKISNQGFSEGKAVEETRSASVGAKLLDPVLNQSSGPKICVSSPGIAVRETSGSQSTGGMNTECTSAGLTPTSTRNLTSFPYIQTLTLLDGQTQHLKIQGSGNNTGCRQFLDPINIAADLYQEPLLDPKKSGVRRNACAQSCRTKQGKRKRDFGAGDISFEDSHKKLTSEDEVGTTDPAM